MKNILNENKARHKRGSDDVYNFSHFETCLFVRACDIMVEVSKKICLFLDKKSDVKITSFTALQEKNRISFLKNIPAAQYSLLVEQAMKQYVH